MTRGSKFKAARRIVREHQEFLTRSGWRSIRTGRSARALPTFAQVVDIFRDGQSDALLVRYGVAPYNCDCHHLHYVLNGKGTSFAF
ncbi:MAG TPA: hypothetical protein PK280_14745 [Planctomycetota bacterium]|nr:hypothetical protein [Planctomycetota bacterium]